MPRSIWIPGSDHGLVWNGGVALLDGSVSAEVIERMWLLLEGGADLPGFLEGLSQACGSGLLGLPGFAIGLVTEQQMHLAVRGDFCAVVADDAGQTRVEGVGVTTWTERLIWGGTEVSVSRLGTSPARGFIFIGGVVPARMIVWRREAAVSDMSGPSSTRGATPPNPETADAAAAQGDESGPVPEPRAHSEGESTRSPGEHTVGKATDGSPALAADAEIARPSQQPIHAGAPEAGATGSRFDVLWGQTVAHSVEEAAVRLQSEDDIAAAPPPRAAEDTLSQPRTSPGDADAAGTRPDNEAGPEAPSRDVFIDAVPRHYPPPPMPPRPRVPGSGIPGDHDGETVARDELGQVVPAESRGDPREVLASMCPEQHPNPPQSATCRICGRTVEGGSSRIPQPVIGRLHTSTGESVDLGGPVIVGRNPRAARFQGAQIPRLLSLPYAHISGSHLELRVEGWSLLAVDLNSTNGTFLRRGDAPPQRIPDAPTPLYAGDVLDFGDDVKITFEFIP